MRPTSPLSLAEVIDTTERSGSLTEDTKETLKYWKENDEEEKTKEVFKIILQENGYTVYQSQKYSLDHFYILKEDNFYTIFDVYECWNCLKFEGIVIMPGHDTVEAFSTKTGKTASKHIR